MTRRRWFPVLRTATFFPALGTGWVCAPYWRPWCVNAFNRVDWPLVAWAVVFLAAVVLLLTFLGGCLWCAVVRALSKGS